MLLAYIIHSLRKSKMKDVQHLYSEIMKEGMHHLQNCTVRLKEGVQHLCSEIMKEDLQYLYSEIDQKEMGEMNSAKYYIYNLTYRNMAQLYINTIARRPGTNLWTCHWMYIYNSN